jgi:hypothetical protein
LSLIGIVVRTTLFWGAVWGFAGFAMAFLATKISPDTGHLPHGLVAAIVAFVSAVAGALSGAAYALVAEQASLGVRGRIEVGGATGAAAVFTVFLIGAMSKGAANSFPHNLIEVIVPVSVYSLVGAALGAARPRSNRLQT